MTPREILDLIIDRAPKLRDAGVSAVTLDGFSFRLGALAPPATSADDIDEPLPPDLDPLSDPETFGRLRVKSRAIKT